MVITVCIEMVCVLSFVFVNTMEYRPVNIYMNYFTCLSFMIIFCLSACAAHVLCLYRAVAAKLNVSVIKDTHILVLIQLLAATVNKWCYYIKQIALFSK